MRISYHKDIAKKIDILTVKYLEQTTCRPISFLKRCFSHSCKELRALKLLLPKMN